ncbi:hypothetical protein VR41_08450 [Streptomyces sp. NRRL B-1568]|nr:hypothetical protein VR41_08450 [Streptomyces sp. NRRL B-1568]
MYDTARTADAATAGAVAPPAAPHGPRYRLVATDLDGTLLRSDSTVSARTRSALRRAQGLGVHHVIVTGRPARGCLPFFTALGYTGLAVCGQGAQVYDAGRGLLLSGTALDTSAARAALSRLTAHVGPLDLAVVTSGDTAEFVITQGFGRGDERELAPYRIAGPAQLWDRPVDKVLLRHPTLSDADLVAAARLCTGPELTVVHAGHRIVELLPTGFDKATGLARVTRSLGLTARDVIAFGDMPNDIPLLRWAGHAVAMANGHPDLKAEADEIAPANDDDGVADVLERILDLGALS